MSKGSLRAASQVSPGAQARASSCNEVAGASKVRSSEETRPWESLSRVSVPEIGTEPRVTLKVTGTPDKGTGMPDAVSIWTTTGGRGGPV